MFAGTVLQRMRSRICRASLLRISLNQKVEYSKSSKNVADLQTPKSDALGEMSSKYQVFVDKDSEVILDMYEEHHKKYAGLLEPQDEEINPLEGIHLERGVHGVYDIQDLVEVLHRENAMDVFVTIVPKEIQYVDYICIVTGKSQKHMQAIVQFVRKIFKKKMFKSDLVPKVEGASSSDWMALDLGNIALHIFSQKARKQYDLESLWAVGTQYDTEYNRQDAVVEMLEKHSIYLHDLRPAR